MRGVLDLEPADILRNRLERAHAMQGMQTFLLNMAMVDAVKEFGEYG